MRHSDHRPITFKENEMIEDSSICTPAMIAIDEEATHSWSLTFLSAFRDCCPPSKEDCPAFPDASHWIETSKKFHSCRQCTARAHQTVRSLFLPHPYDDQDINEHAFCVSGGLVVRPVYTTWAGGVATKKADTKVDWTKARRQYDPIAPSMPRFFTEVQGNHMHMQHEQKPTT